MIIINDSVLEIYYLLIVYKFFFSQAYVFMVGGGNYIEYQNLVDYVKVGNADSNYTIQDWMIWNSCSSSAVKSYHYRKNLVFIV